MWSLELLPVAVWCVHFSTSIVLDFHKGLEPKDIHARLVKIKLTNSI